MVLSEMQLSSSLSELDAQDKSLSGQCSTNSDWDEIFEDSRASQDEHEEELKDTMKIKLQIYLKEKQSK